MDCAIFHTAPYNINAWSTNEPFVLGMVQNVERLQQDPFVIQKGSDMDIAVCHVSCCVTPYKRLFWIATQIFPRCDQTRILTVKVQIFVSIPRRK